MCLRCEAARQCVTAGYDRSFPFSASSRSQPPTPTTPNPCPHSWPALYSMDWPHEYSPEMESQRGPSQTGLQSRLPAPIRRSSNPPCTRSHIRASSISVNKLRQNFQKPDLELKAVSPTHTPITVLPIQSTPSSASNDHPQVHRARLPPRRRVATTPTPNLAPISEAQALPKRRTTSNLGSPLGRDRRSLPPSRIMSPTSSISPIMGTQARRSLTTSESFKILETANDDTQKQSNETPKKLSPSKIPSPVAVGPRRNALRFSSAPVKSSEKKEVSVCKKL
jgi:hypothetical protein